MLLSPTAWKFARALVLLTVSVSYLAYVFRFSEWLPRTRGLGDWQDPYFINALLEHWYRSATSFTDPSSPPMYFPAQKTLAYSHGLILYAPFYVALRLFFHPFHAYTITLFAVLELGILCLYALLRRLGLSFIESLLLTALFFSSRNVVGWETGVWSQRASVFLIPPILLLLLISGRARPRAASLLMGGLAGMLSTLLYVQDFYTAHFAFLLLAIFVVAAAVAGIGRSMIPSRRWFAAVGVGALAGAFVFLWIYFGAYAEHRSFPEEQLLRSLTVRNPSRWRSPLAFIRDLGSYEGLRSFALVFIVGTLAWIPWFEVDRKTRIQSAWFLAISLVVLLIPLRFPEFSHWRALFQRLPGFGVIRDPRRIIQVYELVVVLAMALFLVRLPKRVVSGFLGPSQSAGARVRGRCGAMDPRERADPRL